MKAFADFFTEFCKVVSSFLKHMRLPYLPSNVGLFILAQLASHAQPWDEEATMIKN